MIEFRYTFEIAYDLTPQQKPMLDFASGIQREVGLLGGRVIRTWIENGGKWKTVKCTVQFHERQELEDYIRWYYEDDFSPEEIEHEITLIEEHEEKF